MRTVLLLALLLPGAAMAQVRPITVALVADASEECPLEGLGAAVEARLERSVFVDPEDAEFVVRVHTAENGTLGLRVVVEQLGRPMGERRVPVTSCAELRDRAALIVALVVDTQLPRLPPLPAVFPAGEASGEGAGGGAAATGSATASTGSATASTGSATASTGSATASSGSATASTGSATASSGSATASTGSATASSGSEPAEAAASSSGAAPDPADEREPTTADAGERVETQLALVGAAHVGWLPTLAGGGGLGAAVLGRRWALRVDALGWVPSDSTVRDPVAIRVFGAALRLGGCAGGDLGRVRLAGCGVLEVGALRVEGRGLDEPEARWRLSLRGGLEARATVSFRALRVGLALGVDVPIVRDRFVFGAADASTQVAHEPAPVGGIALLSVGFALP